MTYHHYQTYFTNSDQFVVSYFDKSIKDTFFCVQMSYSRDTYICGNIINNKDEWTHFFRKIYLSHFMWKGCERVVCERWVGDWTNYNIFTPSSSDYSSISFLILLGCSTEGPESPSPLLGAGSHCLELQLELQLTRTACGTGLYHCLTSTCFLWASHLHRIQPVHGQVYILISSTGCTCFLTDCWVEGQYVTQRSFW